MMRIGTASEDAYRRDLTINALFYNINTGQVEDWTGRGFDDLRKGLVATPLPPLTTLLDDPLRVLRSVRFAARLRFTMDDSLVQAAQDVRVRAALANKVSRERVGSEVELMFRSRDPVGAMRLLWQLQLMDTVFPRMPTGEQGLSLLSTAHDHLADCRISPPLWCQRLEEDDDNKKTKDCLQDADAVGEEDEEPPVKPSLSSLSSSSLATSGGLSLLDDEEGRRLLWYSAFLKPLWNFQKQSENTNNDNGTEGKRKSKKKRKHQSAVHQLLLEELKRPTRDADAIAKILTAADEITEIMQSRSVVSATMILLSDINVRQELVEQQQEGEDDDDDNSNDRSTYVTLHPFLNGHRVDSAIEDDPVWIHAMEFRLMCFKVLQRIGPLWRAALILSLSEELNHAPTHWQQSSSPTTTRTANEQVDGTAATEASESYLEYVIEGDVVDETQEELRRGIIERYDIFASAILRLGLMGSWDTTKPLMDGQALKQKFPNIPKGPVFRRILEEQMDWIVMHPGVTATDADLEPLILHLQLVFPEYCGGGDDDDDGSNNAEKSDA